MRSGFTRARPSATIAERLVVGMVVVVMSFGAALVPISSASAGQPGFMCDDQPATIVGTQQSDYLMGTSGADVIVGRGGDDYIFGLGGDDIICGGSDRDFIDGGRGNDRLFGQRGADRIEGEGGKDQLNGGPGSDWLDGGFGRDRVAGLSGPDDECWGELLACEVQHRTRHDGTLTLRITQNVHYGSAGGQKLRLDLFEPRAAAGPQGRPVVVFAHGGGFSSGSKNNSVAQAYAGDLAEQGIVTASINYRLAGVVSLRAFEMAQHDMQAAVRWFRANADDLDIDTDRIYVSGYSAGAIAAGYTNYSPDNTGNSGNPGFPSHVAGAMPIAGFAGHTLVDADEPPILFFQGTNDTTVFPSLPANTCTAAHAVGNQCDIQLYPGGHWLEDWHDEIVDLMVDFIDNTS